MTSALVVLAALLRVAAWAPPAARRAPRRVALRAAATEKPSRGRDQGRKVSPKRDQSGKPAKRDRRRREAGLFTL